MRFSWRDRARDLQAENEGLRRKLDTVLRMVALPSGPGPVPDELLYAIRDARWPGQAVKLDVSWQDETGLRNWWRVAVVVGPEGADHDAIWHDIAAATRACTEGGTPAADYRLIPPVRMALGLRAVVVPDGEHLTAVGSSAVSAHQRAMAVGKAAAAVRGHRLPAASLVPLLLPVWWRKAAAVGAAAVTATALAIPGGQAFHLGSWQPPPASAATHAQAGPRDRSVHPKAPGSGHGGQGGSGVVAAGAVAPSRGGGAERPHAAPSPGTTMAPQPGPTTPQPPPTTGPSPGPTLPVPLPSASVSATVPVPSPSATVKVKVCIQWVLGICVKWQWVIR